MLELHKEQVIKNGMNTRFKPGAHAKAMGSKGGKAPHIDRFNKWMNELPDQLTPWERIHAVTRKEDCPDSEIIKGNAILGNWALKESEIKVEVAVEPTSPDLIDSRIRDLLKSKEEIEKEQSQEDSEGIEDNGEPLHG